MKEKITEEIKKLNREHVEAFVKFGKDSIAYNNYVREYNNKVDVLVNKIRNG